MLVHISLLTAAIPVYYTSEFQEPFKATTYKQVQSKGVEDNIK
jgi:hypothetical protein